MANISKTKAFLLAAMAMLFIFTANAFAQGMDTAYVPFSVNVDATATAQLAGGDKFEKQVRSGYTDTLLIVTEGSTPLAMQGKTPSPVTMYSSRGKISLELSRQLYRSTDIALYSLNGKQIMRGKAAVSEAVKSISHPNVAMGVYLLSVKGVNGGTFTTRFAHTGGGLNIDVAFANGGSGSLMEKAMSGNWTITVSAEGYLDTSYAFVPEVGRGNTGVQEIILQQTVLSSSSSSSEAEPSSSSSSDSINSSSSSSTPPDENRPPNTPTNVTATANSESSITVSWSSVTGATGYHVYRSTTATGTYDSVGTSTTTSYTNTSLSENTTYYYKVASYNSGGTGNQSSYASAATPPNPPDTPTGVTATANSESSITVSWEPITSAGATRYYIYRSTTADGTYTQIDYTFFNSTSYTNTSLSSGTTYYYKVAAYNGGWTSAQSGYASATTPPSVPTGVTATSNSANSITVSWGSVTGATGYYIYHSITASGNYDSVGNSATTSYTNTSLSENTTYYYKVAAYNSGGTSTKSSYVSATTLPNPPDTPTSVTATAIASSQITVSWGSVAGASRYYIYRSTTAFGTYDSVGTSATTSYANTDLSSGTAYYYKVAAYNSGGTGALSDYAYATTLLGVPTGVTATANSESSITISWSSVTSATGYYIYRSTNGNAYDSVGTSATTSYTDTGLSSGTMYYYKVVAYNSGETGNQSSYTYATTPPSVPTSVTAVANSVSSITVSWSSVTGATGYYIYRSESADGTYAQVGTYTTATSYTNTYLSSGTTYYYKVAARNNGGIGTQSSYAYAITPPGTPTVTATANSESSITVSWGSVIGATEYYIYRSTNSYYNYDSIGTSETTSYTDNSLLAYTTYYYKVAAYNNGGTSNQSSYAFTTTLPGAPTNVTATANSVSSISVSWGSVIGATGYRIYRSTTADGTYDSVGTSAGGQYYYFDNSLSSGTTYYYKVAAYNSGGTGTQSSYASAVTPLGVPTGVTATANSENGITVSWSSITGATGYYIYRSTTASGTYDSIDTSEITSYADNFLSSGTTYYYKVVAYNSNVTSTQSNYAYATILPSMPTGVTAITNSVSSITVSWEPVTGAIGYYVYRSTTADGNYSSIILTATTSFADNSLSSGTTYYYKVAAYNNGGTGNKSGYAYATTLPSSPTSVTATANSESDITVSWGAVTGAIGYYIYRLTIASGTYDSVGTSETTSYADNSLLSGTTYYYNVAAYNSGGTGNQSNYASTTTLLDVPTNVTATANSVSSITVSWESVKGATGYRIYRSTTADGTYSSVTSTSSTLYADNSLSSGTTYYYKVAAYNSNVTSNQSGYASATILPSKPTSVTATANSEGSITVSWSSVTGAAGYYIYRSESYYGTYDSIGTSATTSYEDTFLSANTAYYYKVAAYNSGGTGNKSSYTFTRTLPSAPTSVTATANSANSITVSWESVTGATEYYIYRSTTSNGTYSQVGTSATNSYTNTSLSTNTTYYYKVAAYNSGGTGNQSGYVSATTLPSAPTSVTATANSANSIAVSWESVTGATGYYIYRSTTSNGTYSQVGTSATNSYTNTSLSANTTYYYKVAAYNSGGTGNQSGYVSATTPPSAPTSVKAVVNSESSITVSWSSVTGATGYYIYLSTSNNSTFAKIDSTASKTTSYINTGLSANTAYYYKVAAYNNRGTGFLSDYAVATTLLDVPTNVTATVNSVSSITVSWRSVIGATRYYIYRSITIDGTYDSVGTSATTSYTNTSLSSSTTYYYKVAAYNNSRGISNQSSYASATTLLDVPTNVTAATNSESSITVSWGTVTGATGYYIYRNTTVDGTYDSIGTSATTSYTNTSLSSSTTYYYKVVAYNSEETSTQSNYTSATTLLPAVSTCDGMAGTTITIGNQTWMKKNLNCNVSGSKCYDNNSTNCDTYGRLYDWAMAMNLPSSCKNISCPVQHPHKGICPSGWHLPSDAEWETLIDFAGGLSTAGRKLKAASGWNNYNSDRGSVSGNGTDDHGFSALPGGFGFSYGSYRDVGNEGYWWSTDESYRSGEKHAFFVDYGNYSTTSNIGPAGLVSVRCLKD